MNLLECSQGTDFPEKKPLTSANDQISFILYMRLGLKVNIYVVCYCLNLYRKGSPVLDSEANSIWLKVVRGRRELGRLGPVQLHWDAGWVRLCVVQNRW